MDSPPLTTADPPRPRRRGRLSGAYRLPGTRVYEPRAQTSDSYRRDGSVAARRLLHAGRTVTAGSAVSDAAAPMVGDELEQWLRGDQPKTLGNIIELFGPRGFALVFVLLMAVPALPLPTGGVTHVLEVVTMLVALQLVVGRRRIWVPARWQNLQLAGPSREKLLTVLLRRIRWLERYSRPRASWLFDHVATRSEEHTSELQSHVNLVCRLLLEKKKEKENRNYQ